jgi:hypothetical protein
LNIFPLFKSSLHLSLPITGERILADPAFVKVKIPALPNWQRMFLSERMLSNKHDKDLPL